MPTCDKHGEVFQSTCPGCANDSGDQVKNPMDCIQDEVNTWAHENFGKRGERCSIYSFQGIVEEVGELSHALLKKSQGIRGTPQYHEAKTRDAIGDMLIYVLDFCAQNGWSAYDILESTWREVRKRNWNANSFDGGTIQ